MYLNNDILIKAVEIVSENWEAACFYREKEASIFYAKIQVNLCFPAKHASLLFTITAEIHARSLAKFYGQYSSPCALLDLLQRTHFLQESADIPVKTMETKRKSALIILRLFLVFLLVSAFSLRCYVVLGLNKFKLFHLPFVTVERQCPYLAKIKVICKLSGLNVTIGCWECCNVKILVLKN